DFGRRTRQEDPIVHFYETFLAAYDPKLRESRGVYYTPEPVVSYIVRSVDVLLKTRFNCPQGLADSSTITIPNYDPGLTVKGKKQPRKTAESHKVLILDPATGTGTFLYAVIDHIRQQFMQQGNAGMWPGYVKNHLLPRLFGFELLMAPYAVAHFKLSLQLAGRDLPDILRDQWAYHPADDERLGIYLTNALEEAHEMTGLPLFTQWVADETNAANEVKTLLPVLVVMGNPPYSGHSANKSDWISGLLKGKLHDGGKTGNYYEVDGQPLGERNPKWLQDDYVKFIRFGQWRIECSGGGILAFITNHGYLDNPTFRGMRQSLMQTFTDIYILDLHGNAKKRETAPDGGKDENVFDIQQGVAIGIFVKQPNKSGPADVYHADLRGTRAKKYEQLFEQDVAITDWAQLRPQLPFYLFMPQNVDLLGEYNRGWKVTDIMLINGWGVATRKDYLLVDFSIDALVRRFKDIHSLSVNEAIDKYKIKESPHWDFASAKGKIQENVWESVKPVLFRPFDIRHVFYEKFMIERGDHRYDLMANMFYSNLALITVRRSETSGVPKHFYCTNNISVLHSTSAKEGNFVFPLFLYPTEAAAKQSNLLNVATWPPDEAHGGRVPNLNPEFVVEMAQKLRLTFTPSAAGDLQTTFGPEDIFHYIYAIFHSPTYRTRYAEFLKIDFPRVPLTADVALFRTLCGLGKELVGLHLLESPQAGQFSTRYPIAGDNLVDKGYPKYVPPQNDHPGRININKSQYFEGISPEVWEFYIGGYQVLGKWLKDRQGRQLSYDDLTHYQQVVVALQKTIELMEKIDNVIPEWPIG
ncbi:MAG: type ISP restriction/modification enzyme, partial [Syntrophus sp. (in: bacteria)]